MGMAGAAGCVDGALKSTAARAHTAIRGAPLLLVVAASFLFLCVPDALIVAACVLRVCRVRAGSQDEACVSKLPAKSLVLSGDVSIITTVRTAPTALRQLVTL